MQTPPDIEMPEGVQLRDFGDFDAARKDIYDRTKQAMIESYPMSWGGVRAELHDVDYDGADDFSIEDQKKALLEDRYLSRRLRGTVKLFDDKTGEQLDETRLSLMRVPYLTRRGTFIHGGNEYTSIMQSRLLPGVYTRRQDNGGYETQFNLRQARSAFRVGFEPETTQYRLKIGQANMHMYSLLKDLGVDDERLKKMWGEDIFKANSSKYDSRVFEKAYERLVPTRQRNKDATREDKALAIKEALEAAEVNTSVMRKNLPNRFDMLKSAEWNARWAGRELMMEKIAARSHTDIFKPDLSPEECFDALTDTMLFKCAGEEWNEIDNAGPDIDFNPDLKPNELKEQYNNLYARMGDRLAGMGSWSKEWMPAGSNQLGWLDWYFGYMGGKRTSDDDRQIKRWKSFKARSLGGFLKNPTPRAAFSLRNWAIDPKLYIDDDAGKILQRRMDEYREKKFHKAAAEDSNTTHLKMLLDAKSHSDAKRYGHKHFLVQRSMTERPDEWVVDSPGGPHPGVTHTPTGFRLHLPHSKIPPAIKIDKTYALQKQDSQEEDTHEKIAAFDSSELQALAQYLNTEHNAGLAINVSTPQLEQQILDFIEGEGGVNPGLLTLATDGVEQAEKDYTSLNESPAPIPQQSSIWRDVTKASTEEEPKTFTELCEKAASELEDLRKRIREGTQNVAEPKSKEQAEAGNYKKGHFAWKGLNITVENPKGSIRKGKDGKGNSWKRTMRHEYGYIKKTESEADGDHIDVFFGPDVDSEIVFVVDQCSPGKPGKPFDEHKCMCGFKTKNQAKEAYLSNYTTGWKGMISVTALTLDQFKWWIFNGDTGTPLSSQDWF